MREVSVREMRHLLARLDAVLAVEGELVITRHGRPVARLLPPIGRARRDNADLRALIPALPRTSEHHLAAEREDR